MTSYVFYFASASLSTACIAFGKNQMENFLDCTTITAEWWHDLLHSGLVM